MKLSTVQICQCCNGTGKVAVADPIALRRRRKEMKINIMGMAFELGVARSYLHYIETGQRPCPKRILEYYEKL